jgi:hypothetical protein
MRRSELKGFNGDFFPIIVVFSEIRGSSALTLEQQSILEETGDKECGV